MPVGDTLQQAKRLHGAATSAAPFAVQNAIQLSRTIPGPRNFGCLPDRQTNSTGLVYLPWTQPKLVGGHDTWLPLWNPALGSMIYI